MAKANKKTNKKAPEKEVKNKKKVDEEVKSKKTEVPAKKPKKSKVSEAVEEVKDKKVANDDWDETASSGGDFLSLPSGKYFGRIRSVISLGQVQFSFSR